MSKLPMSNKIIGWDIGGAHLKAALLDEHGEVLQALQLPCPLWKGLDYLERAILTALQPQGLSPQNIPAKAGYSCVKAFKIKPAEVTHAVTMTGELVDLFQNRHEGVIAISTLAAKLLGKDTLFYAANDGFVRLERVSALTASIASANWHVSASALAMQVNDALFIDIGSTTTDIIAISNGKLNSTNVSDAARMADDSLVYTGVVRTPVMALAQKLFVDNVETNVAAEYFATMADVYRLTNELLPEHDMAETADGKGKTALESARRLARMVGHDVESKPMQTWLNLANTCKTLHMQQIKSAVLKHLKSNMTIIGAGAGSFLVKQIADDLDIKFIHAWESISTCLPAHIDENKKHNLEVCFPAFAVAILARQHA